MKLFYRILFAAVLYLFNGNVTSAQEKPLTNAYKKQAIQTLSDLMNDYYVFPEVAKKTEKHLFELLEEGHFNSAQYNDEFASALTIAVQDINKDKHMRIRARRPVSTQPDAPDSIIDRRIEQINRSRSSNYGFFTVKVLDGNVGYLDLRGFAGLENAAPTADAAMKLMSRTDAVIVDLSRNGGGSPRMVQYLCSYFFDEEVHLNSLYWREGDITEEFWTLHEVGGAKMPDVPLFIITSNRTFSAAEEFSYNMQTQQRATLVGETTGGGANPGGTRAINENLNVFIPTGRAINPITKTNWEGVGVVPEIEAGKEEAFQMAYDLAMKAAESFRAKTGENYRQHFANLNKNLNAYASGKSDEPILKDLTRLKAINLLGEGDINRLGYEYLMEHKKPEIAAAIFKANIVLYPDSANTYDSYAECLMNSGQFELALKNYQKAVETAIENEDRDVEFYKKNMEALKAKINAKK